MTCSVPTPPYKMQDAYSMTLQGKNCLSTKQNCTWWNFIPYKSPKPFTESIYNHKEINKHKYVQLWKDTIPPMQPHSSKSVKTLIVFTIMLDWYMIEGEIISKTSTEYMHVVHVQEWLLQFILGAGTDVEMRDWRGGKIRCYKEPSLSQSLKLLTLTIHFVGKSDLEHFKSVSFQHTLSLFCSCSVSSFFCKEAA